MTKATQLLVPLAVVLALWTAVLLQWIPVALSPELTLIWPTVRRRPRSARRGLAAPTQG